jgi:hypothetical protein
MDSVTANTSLIRVMTAMWPRKDDFIYVGNRDGSGCNSINYVSTKGSHVLGRENCSNYITAVYEFTNIEREQVPPKVFLIMTVVLSFS